MGFLDHDGPVVYAHRGGNERHPENSMASFADAVAQGFTYLETDVRLSADGVLVALHDSHLERVSDGRGRWPSTPPPRWCACGCATPTVR
ncbi:MAG: glycerophosphodiester phosphodiesterase family protein [Acidimicrobiales bacterium]